MGIELWDHARRELDAVRAPGPDLERVLRRSRSVRAVRVATALLVMAGVVAAVAFPAAMLSGIRGRRPEPRPVLASAPPARACPEPTFGCPDVDFAEEVVRDAGLDVVERRMTAIHAGEESTTFLVWALHAEDEEHRVPPLQSIIPPGFHPRSPIHGTGLLTDGTTVVWQAGRHALWFDPLSAGTYDQVVGQLILAARRVAARQDREETAGGPSPPDGVTHSVARGFALGRPWELRAYAVGRVVCWELVGEAGLVCDAPSEPSTEGALGARHGAYEQEGASLSRSVIHGLVFREDAVEVRVRLANGKRFGSRVHRHPDIPYGIYVIHHPGEVGVRMTMTVLDGSGRELERQSS